MKKNLLKSMVLGISLSIISAFSFGQLNITPASGPNVCDGTAAISNPSGVILSSITWYGNGAIIASGVYQIGNLCPGNYGVYYNQTNPAGGIDSLNATFMIMGQGPNPCSTLNATITQIPCTTPTSNDGALNVSVSGGNPPYMYTWSNGTITQNLTNLWPGYTYCLYVQDAAGCSFQVCDSMTVLSPNAGDTLIVNNANCGPAAGGTFVQQFEDCNFNFNACASGSMTSSNVIGDTVQTVWTFVDSMGVTLATYNINYYVPNAGSFNCVNLQFILYCPIKSSNIKTIVVNDMVQLSGLTEIVKNPFTVINPMGNELMVQFDEVTTGTMRLFNLNGQVVKTQSLTAVQQTSIVTTNLPAGTYFFQLEVGSTVYTQKVIK